MLGTWLSRLSTGVASLGVLAAALVGCSDDAPRAQPTQSATAASTTRAPESSATQAPTKPAPPALPAAAKEDSKAGVKAFVGWYVDLFNYSANTGNVTMFSQYGEWCRSCQNYASEIEDTYAQGGAFKGVNWVDDRYFVDDTDHGYFVSVGISASAYSRRTTQNGQFSDSPAESFELSFEVERAADTYRIRDIRVLS
jgi:hypothetical protein